MLESISPLGFRRLDFRNAARFAKTRGIIYKSAGAASATTESQEGRRNRYVTCVQGGTTGALSSATQGHMCSSMPRGAQHVWRIVESPEGESNAIEGSVACIQCMDVRMRALIYIIRGVHVSEQHFPGSTSTTRPRHRAVRDDARHHLQVRRSGISHQPQGGTTQSTSTCKPAGAAPVSDESQEGPRNHTTRGSQ